MANVIEAFILIAFIWKLNFLVSGISYFKLTDQRQLVWNDIAKRNKQVVIKLPQDSCLSVSKRAWLETKWTEVNGSQVSFKWNDARRFRIVHWTSPAAAGH